MLSPLVLTPSIKDWLQADSEDEDDPAVLLRPIRVMTQHMQALEEHFRPETARLQGTVEALAGQKEALVQEVKRREKYEEEVSGAIGDTVQQAEEAVQDDVQSGIESSARECPRTLEGLPQASEKLFQRRRDP